MGPEESLGHGGGQSGTLMASSMPTKMKGEDLLPRPNSSQIDPTGSMSPHSDTSSSMYRLQEQDVRRLGVAEKWYVPFEELQVGDKIGEGSFCNIYACQWRGSTVVLKKHKDKRDIADLVREVDVLRTTRHPSIVMFLGATQNESGEIMMLMEYIKGKTLLEFGYGRQPFSKKLKVATQMAKALSFLHMCNPPVLYRDLKPRNVMVTPHGDAKILDFGLSKFVDIVSDGMGDGSTGYVMTGGTGTRRFMAPEVMQHKNYDLKVDVWSFGLCMFFLFAGGLPFEPDPEMRVARFHNGDRRALDLEGMIRNSRIRNIIDRCTKIEPEERPTMQQIQQEFSDLENHYKSSSSTCSCM